MNLQDHKDILEGIRRELAAEEEAIKREEGLAKETNVNANPKPLKSFSLSQQRFISMGWYAFSHRLREFLIGSESKATECVYA